MQIITKKLSTLKPSPYNPRKDLTPDDPEYQKLKKSILEFDYIDPIIWNKHSNRVIGGHQRLKILKEIGRNEIEVSVVDLPDDKEKALNIALNKISGEWDYPKLKDLLVELDTGALDMEMTGFDEDELKALIDFEGKGGGGEAPEPQIDKADELQKKWKTKLGQIWDIGKHRLMCGDSTKKEDIERLMEGKKANMVLTDPPYGYDQKGVPGDDPKKLNELINKAVSNLPIENGIIAAFQSPRTFPVWLDAIRANKYTFERMLWLYKEAQCTFPWRGWILKSESILLSSLGNNLEWQDVKPYSHDCYKLSEVSNELNGDAWHGSVKPLIVVSDIMQRISKKSAFIFDGFIGSGTTMVAAEQLNRICYGMEIEPKYVAVTLQRMADMGLKPKMVTS